MGVCRSNLTSQTSPSHYPLKPAPYSLHVALETVLFFAPRPLPQQLHPIKFKLRSHLQLSQTITASCPYLGLVRSGNLLYSPWVCHSSTHPTSVPVRRTFSCSNLELIHRRPFIFRFPFKSCCIYLTLKYIYSRHRRYVSTSKSGSYYVLYVTSTPRSGIGSFFWSVAICA